MYIYTGWRRPIGCLISGAHFSQKSPIISGSFAKRDLFLKASYASSLPCTYSSSWALWIDSLLWGCIVFQVGGFFFQQLKYLFEAWMWIYIHKYMYTLSVSRSLSHSHTHPHMSVCVRVRVRVRVHVRVVRTWWLCGCMYNYTYEYVI